MDGWYSGRLRRGPIDVVAGKDGRTVLVQVKSDRSRVKKTELQAIIDWGRAFNADAEVWHFKGRGEVERRRVFAARRSQEQTT